MPATPPAATDKQRIEIIDALRGFAFLGLFLVHMVEYFELHWRNPESSPSFEWVFLVFGGKAYAIFALLFGVSFHIIMQNQAQKGVDFRRRFCWRLTVLAIFGYVHGLLYSGDILQVLALCGLILVLLFRLSSLKILCFACFFLFQGPMYLHIALIDVGLLSNTNPINWSLGKDTLQIYAEGNLQEVFARNAFYAQLGKWLFFIESGRLWHVVGLTLLGFVIGRKDIFRHIKDYRLACVLGLIACCVSLFICRILKPDVANIFNDAATLRIIQDILGFYQNSFIMLAEVLIFVLAYNFFYVRAVLNLQAAAGRLSLSMYIIQSIIGVPLFYGFGLALYENISHAQALVMGIILWVLQVTLAKLWLRHYRYGPMEWAWRALTYFPGRIDGIHQMRV